MVGLLMINWISTQEMSDMSILVSNAKPQLKKKAVIVLNIRCNAYVNSSMDRFLWLKNIPPKPENLRQKI